MNINIFNEINIRLKKMMFYFFLIFLIFFLLKENDVYIIKTKNKTNRKLWVFYT